MDHRAPGTKSGKPASSAGRGQAVSAAEASNFPCPYNGCKEGFRLLRDLRKHKLVEHDYCMVCDEDFDDYDSFHKHKIMSERHITCAVCSMDFKSEAGRDRHYLQVCCGSYTTLRSLTDSDNRRIRRPITSNARDAT